MPGMELTSDALRRVAAAVERSGKPSRTRTAAALRLVLALAEGGSVPPEVVEAFREYLGDAVDDYAYASVEDFIGYLDFLGLLDESPELGDLGEGSDGPGYGWEDLVQEVSGDYDVIPESGRGQGEWSVTPVEKAASGWLSDRPDYG